MRGVAFTPTAWAEFTGIVYSDKQKSKRILNLIKDIQRNPFEGIGKPEPLKYELQGYWSRRIDEKNRLVYAVEEERIVIVQCTEHY
ncbi:toxin YoeB [Dysgonomonas sp. PFB1-18]|uniref:Txe/YoeB family addiction module toxin n=1 Tax=unclassified Dysgonomonas TaxID=2630389 RepID=UPI002473D53E|nr:MULTISPECIES: Txe/YoeB family addiction module toxin [unclassified Dysgonomonas]MDH6311058.1 toxin YoeB [Dysgonomonas sp. PF1-14]MDH6341104.1 toxin YoeB [Dysgonomonas sp. PF1-16]MDH6382557.1 toxin YoeB [Dysgonomonas sp. PFB1-18]MDH6399909.1 toxin YoeB [Dysgonomonas sp. PF1-23]